MVLSLLFISSCILLIFFFHIKNSNWVSVVIWPYLISFFSSFYLC